MGSVTELIETPLTSEQLAQRYRALAEDPRLANLPGKIELDVWGCILVSPASNLHALLQGQMIQRLSKLGGEALAEASVSTEIGILVTDVAWMSSATAASLGTRPPYPLAPDLCIEIVSPSSSRKEVDDKTAAYLGSGAREVWVVYPQTRRIEWFSPEGKLDHPTLAMDTEVLFDPATTRP